MDAVHIVGAGGIGSTVGYALRQSGVPVVFVETDAAKIEDGRKRGVRIDQRPAVAAEFVHFDDWRQVPGGWVLLCTKCYDNAAVLKRIAVPVRLLPIQNGFDEGLDRHGHDFEGIASFVAENERGTMHTHITRSGALHLGRKTSGGASGELQSFAAALAKEKLFRAKVVPSIEPFKHTKLMYNAAISPLAAASGVDNGKLLSVPAARRLFFALIQENHAILIAAGKALGTIGPFHPSTVAGILRRKWLAVMLARFFEPSLRGTYCSMAGEIQKGRTELDNYNGYLLQHAQKTGTPAPLNQAVYELVARMTAQRAQPDPIVLDELSAHLS